LPARISSLSVVTARHQEPSFSTKKHMKSHQPGAAPSKTRTTFWRWRISVPAGLTLGLFLAATPSACGGDQGAEGPTNDGNVSEEPIGPGGSADGGGASNLDGSGGSGAGTGGSAGGSLTTGGSAATDGSGGTGDSGGTAGSGGTGDTGGTGGSADTDPDAGQPIGFATLNGGTIGGQGGEVVTVSTYGQLKSYAESSTPYIIMVEGTISNGSSGGSVSIRSNKSIIGIGSTAFLSGVGLEIRDNNNVIIRNLRISLVGTNTPSSVNGGDIISIRGSSKNIWIDHCELFSEDPDVQTDLDKYDGLIDIRDHTGFITISWCYLHDHHKGGLVGASDTDLYADRKVTFHHNYYNKVRLRVPMYRGSTGHFFNNYIVGARDATEIRVGTCVRVEKNYYEALRYSIYTPTDAPGSTQRIDNIEVARDNRAYPANCTADIPYPYSDALTDNTNDVKTVVPEFAGVGKI
jgi:pectate lyase